MKKSLYVLLGALFFVLPHAALAYNVDARGGTHINATDIGGGAFYQVSPADVSSWLAASGHDLLITGCGSDGNCNQGYSSFSPNPLGPDPNHTNGMSGAVWDDVASSTPTATINGADIYNDINSFFPAYCSAGVCTGAILTDVGWTGGPPNFIVQAGSPYILFTVNSSHVITFQNPTPTNTHTSIQITDPTQGTTTPSTTFNINATYTIGTDLNTFSIDGSLPTQVGINLTLLNVATNQQINLGTDYSISQTVGTYTYATTTTQAQSDYTLIATLVGDYGFTPPPPDCTPFPPFTTCTGSGNISTLATALPPPTFSVDNGLFPILGFQVGSTTSRAGLATTTCSITAIGGCFQNALAFLFFPSPNILDQFSLLWSLIQNKPPFGYVSQTISGLRSINASSTPAFSFGNIPLVSVIFTPFRTGLAGILWVGFFIAWYRGRLRHLDI